MLAGVVDLARAYELTRQPDRAADAYARAIELEDGIAPLQAAFAESSIIAAPIRSRRSTPSRRSASRARFS